MKKFVILSLPRSGTNNIQSVINLHPRAFCWGEHMIGINDTDKPRRFPSFFKPKNNEYQHRTVKDEDMYLQAFFSGEYFLNMHVDPELPWNFGDPGTGKDAVGFRFFDYHQSPHGLDLLTREKYKVIFIERQDMFWSTISHILMHKNIVVGQSWKWDDTDIRGEPCEIDNTEFERIRAIRKMSIERCLFFLNEHNIDYIHLKYENMFNPAVYNSIFEHLSLSPLESYPDRYKIINREDKKATLVTNIHDLKVKYL